MDPIAQIELAGRPVIRVCNRLVGQYKVRDRESFENDLFADIVAGFNATKDMRREDLDLEFPSR